MQTIYDYLGNEIKEGMVIKIISVKPINLINKMFAIKKQSTGEFIKSFKSIKKPVKYIKTWFCLNEFEVVKGNDGLLKFVIIGSHAKIKIPLTAINYNLSKHQLLTIKGISDNKKDYLN
jgi:hypothetical protein